MISFSVQLRNKIGIPVIINPIPSFQCDFHFRFPVPDEPCGGETCQNGGVFHDDGTCVCDCPEGYEGAFCECEYLFATGQFVQKFAWVNVEETIMHSGYTLVICVGNPHTKDK